MNETRIYSINLALDKYRIFAFLIVSDGDKFNFFVVYSFYWCVKSLWQYLVVLPRKLDSFSVVHFGRL